MLIDWVTVGAQIFNFLILLLLLKRFLYRPVLRVLEERERRIAQSIEQARQAEETARLRAEALDEEKKAFHEAREGLINEARAEVLAWREKTLEDSRLEVERLREAWLDNLDRDRESFLVRLREQVARQVLEIGEKVLKDLAGQRLERQVIRVFLERVEEQGRPYLAQGRTDELEVHSGFPLEEEDVRVLRDRLRSWMPGEGKVHFSLEKGLGIGVQVSSGDWKVAWNLSHYLTGLEKEILDELSQAGRKGI